MLGYDLFANLSLVPVVLEDAAEAMSGSEEAVSTDEILDDEVRVQYLGEDQCGVCCSGLWLLFFLWRLGVRRGKGQIESVDEEEGLTEVEALKERREEAEEAVETAKDEFDSDGGFAIIDEWSLCNDELMGFGTDKADGIGLADIRGGCEHVDSGEEAGLFEWFGWSKALAKGDFGLAFGVDSQCFGGFGGHWCV